MRRLITLASVVCVALVMGTGAFAQVPSNPDNPNDAVPEALNPPPYGEPINLATAKMVARRHRRSDQAQLECVLRCDRGPDR